MYVYILMVASQVFSKIRFLHLQDLILIASGVAAYLHGSMLLDSGGCFHFKSQNLFVGSGKSYSKIFLCRCTATYDSSYCTYKYIHVIMYTQNVFLCACVLSVCVPARKQKEKENFEAQKTHHPHPPPPQKKGSTMRIAYVLGRIRTQILALVLLLIMSTARCTTALSWFC